jgi:GxxExxY protein
MEGTENTEKKMVYEELTENIYAACIEVHSHSGPGLLESTYEACLCQEMAQRNLSFRRQVAMPVQYKGISIDCGYRLDLIVEEKVIMELKAVEKILPIHEAQLLTYLRLSHYRVGLLVNFNVKRIVDGITRRVV